jgi:hypothetical protein
MPRTKEPRAFDRKKKQKKRFGAGKQIEVVGRVRTRASVVG